MPETVMVRLIRISLAGLGNFFEPVFRILGLTEEFFPRTVLVDGERAGLRIARVSLAISSEPAGQI